MSRRDEKVLSWQVSSEIWLPLFLDVNIYVIYYKYGGQNYFFHPFGLRKHDTEHVVWLHESSVPKTYQHDMNKDMNAKKVFQTITIIVQF